MTLMSGNSLFCRSSKYLAGDVFQQVNMSDERVPEGAACLFLTVEYLPIVQNGYVAVIYTLLLG